MTMSSIRSYNADRDGLDQRCCRSREGINGFCAVRLRVFLSDLKGGEELRFSDGLLQHGSDFVLVQP